MPTNPCPGGMVTAREQRAGLFRRRQWTVTCQHCGHLWTMRRTTGKAVRVFTVNVSMFGHTADGSLTRPAMPVPEPATRIPHEHDMARHGEDQYLV